MNPQFLECVSSSYEAAHIYKIHLNEFYIVVPVPIGLSENCSWKNSLNNFPQISRKWVEFKGTYLKMPPFLVQVP